MKELLEGIVDDGVSEEGRRGGRSGSAAYLAVDELM